VLKVFLKHKLYEYCINLIFDSFTKNFTQPNIEGIKVGDRFKEIIVKDHATGVTLILCSGTLTVCHDLVFFGEIYKTLRFRCDIDGVDAVIKFGEILCFEREI